MRSSQINKMAFQPWNNRVEKIRTAEEMLGYGVLSTNDNRTLRETEVESHTIIYSWASIQNVCSVFCAELGANVILPRTANDDAPLAAGILLARPRRVAKPSVANLIASL